VRSDVAIQRPPPERLSFDHCTAGSPRLGKRNAFPGARDDGGASQ